MKRISVSNLSKWYRIGLKEKPTYTLMSRIGNMLFSPFDNLRKLRALNRMGVEDDSVFWALKDVSFEVKEGEILGIIGKNGAGKSTLLKILSQITEPTSGKIEIQGRVSSLLEVGTGFHPELSGRENIYMNGTILGMTRFEINKRLDEIIDFSGVEKFIDTPVKFYSSGMKVRLGFSVAAHLEPEILIIDEVLSVGDSDFQKKCLGKMEDVSKNQGRTVLFVSHQLSMVSSLCTQVICLDSGKIGFIGETNYGLEYYLKNTEATTLKSIDEINLKDTGSKTILLNSCSIISNDISIRSYGNLEIDLEFILNEESIIENARIDLRIDSALGDKLIWMSSKINNEIDLNKKRCSFYIDKLPLVSGEYFLTIYIHDGKSVSAHYHEFVRFFVTDSTYFNNDLKIPLGQTSMITDFTVN